MIKTINKTVKKNELKYEIEQKKKFFLKVFFLIKVAFC